MDGAPSEPAVRDMLKAKAARSKGGQVSGALVELRVAYPLILLPARTGRLLLDEVALGWLEAGLTP
jgi:hypothetical protein